MNTLTHALIGAVVFGRPTLTLGLIGATLAGAAFPDVSILVMVAWEVGVNGVTSDELWGQAYYREPWITYSAITNSFFVFGGFLALGLWQRWPWLIAFAGSAMLHFLGDIFLHYDDGHAHFWPISMCIFYSPISYWDPNHYGIWWTGLEMVLALGLFLVVWRQNKSALARAYAGILTGLFWAMSLLFLWFVLIGGGMDDRPESSGHDKFVQPACPGSVDVARQHDQIVG